MESRVIGYESTIFKAILFTVSYLMIGLAIPTMMNIILRKYLGDSFSAWINILTIIILSILFFIGVTRITNYKAAIFGNITITGILSAIGCALFFYLVLDNFLDPVFDSVFPASAVEYQEALVTLRQYPAAAFIRVCLIAPITEELLMRGYVFTGLQNKYGVIIALLISTILFAILHFNFVQTLSAVICGLLLGLLYIKTNSLFCCIVAHMLYNSISYYTEIIAGN